MRIQSLAATVAILLSVSAVSAAAAFAADVPEALRPPPAGGHTPYVALRTRLLRAGWTLVITNDVMADGTRRKDEAETRAMVKAGFSEVQSCSGVDLNYCVFNFRKRTLCLRVDTYGEYDAANESPVVFRRRTFKCGR
jgi:hypothetical protein